MSTNPLEKIIFAQRVIAFGSINLANPLKFSLVTSSWDEAVTKYGAAALAWSKQLEIPHTMTKEQAAAEEETENQRLKDEKEKQEREEQQNRFALGWGLTLRQRQQNNDDQQEKPIPPAPTNVDSYVLRKKKAKKFLMDVLMKGRGSLTAWALAEMRKVGYWDFLPLDEPQDPEEGKAGSRHLHMGFRRRVRRFGMDADDDEVLNAEPKHFKGALIKMLHRGSWPEGAKLLLLDKESIPRESHSVLLYRACSSGQISTVKLLLFDEDITKQLGDFKSSDIVNAPYDDRVPVRFALAIAAEKGFTDILETLLQVGAEIEVTQQMPEHMKNRPSHSATMSAANQRRHDERVANWKGEKRSAVMAAIESGQTSCLRILLQWVKDNRGAEALQQTVSPPVSIQEKPEVQKIMNLKAGEKISSSHPPHAYRRNNNTLPIYYAAQNSKLELVELLLEFGADVDQSPDCFCPIGTHYYGRQQQGNSTALTVAISQWAPAEFTNVPYQVMNEAGFGRSGWGAPRPTPEEQQKEEEFRKKMAREISDKGLKIIRLLLEKGGADVNGWDRKRNCQNQAPLYAAIEGAGSPEIVKILVEEYGADIYGDYDLPLTKYYYESGSNNHWCYYLEPSRGRQAIHVASVGARNMAPRALELLTYLLNRSNNTLVNAIDNLGQTPIFYTVSSGRSNRQFVDVARLLLERGAFIDAKRDGDEAQPLHCLNIGDWSYTKPDVRAREVLQLFLEYGCDVNARTAHPALDTPLHFLAARSNRHLVKVLVEAGADVNAKNGYNVTPLMAAIMVPECDAYDEETDTRVEFAGAGCRIRNLEVLLAMGAKFDPKKHDADDITAFLPGCEPMTVMDLVQASGRQAAVRFFNRKLSKN